MATLRLALRFESNRFCSGLCFCSCFSNIDGGGAALLNWFLHVCVPLYVISNTVGSSSDL